MITEGLTCLLQCPVANASNQALIPTIHLSKTLILASSLKKKIKKSYMPVKAPIDINYMF